MNFDEATKLLDRNERFKATVYAVNTLLLSKGIYSGEEFERLFIEHARNHVRDNYPASPSPEDVYEVVSKRDWVWPSFVARELDAKYEDAVAVLRHLEKSGRLQSYDKGRRFRITCERFHLEDE